MRHGRYIYILGDIHGCFNALNAFINRQIRQCKTLRTIVPYWKKDDDDFRVLILQCGDFAFFWPGEAETSIQNKIDFLPGGYVPIYWTGGNHEDWDKLDMLGNDICEVGREIFYCPFGSIFDVSPDTTILFAGGAESSDKDWRLGEMAMGSPKIWWEQEGISEEDMQRLAYVPKADWVISHSAPSIFDVDERMRSAWGYGSHLDEPSRFMLDRVLKKFHPKKWFFGHYHHFMHGFTAGCDWECLANIGSGSTWWTKIWLEWAD